MIEPAGASDHAHGMPLSSAWLAKASLLVPIDDASRAGTLNVVVGGRSRRFVLPITLTPFASVRPCSARCVFCSETLVPSDATLLSAALRPSGGYFAAFASALVELRSLPMGISLSGLEATDHVPWLFTVLDSLAAHEAAGGRLTQKILYSNGAGLADADEAESLVQRLVRFGLTRAELSRHHDHAESNQRIMRFREGVSVERQQVFEQVVAALMGRIHVRLVCVVQHGGVDSLAGVRRYLDWARDLGVSDVVFRELSRLGDRYRPNATFARIASTRIPIEAFLQEVWPDAGSLAAGFALAGGKQGYYYWNLRLRYRDAMDVTFETSDYVVMKRRHHSPEIYKLVFHGNGALCGDWDPAKDVLLAGEPLWPDGVSE
jgi:hypothetical protein